MSGGPQLEPYALTNPRRHSLPLTKRGPILYLGFKKLLQRRKCPGRGHSGTREGALHAAAGIRLAPVGGRPFLQNGATGRSRRPAAAPRCGAVRRLGQGRSVEQAKRVRHEVLVVARLVRPLRDDKRHALEPGQVASEDELGGLQPWGVCTQPGASLLQLFFFFFFFFFGYIYKESLHLF